MAYHPSIVRKDTVSLALDTANAAVRIASKQLTGNAGTVEIPNANGTSTIMGEGAGSTGVAQWVGDTTAPGKPLGITAESHNGAIWVSWDGTLDGGIPADFDHVQFTAVDGSQTVDMGQLKAAGKVTAAELTAGDTVTITAIAYDNAHDADGNSAPNASEVSDSVTVVVQSAVEASAVQQAQDDAQDAINKAGQAITASNDAKTAAQAAKDDNVTGYSQQYAQNSDPNTAPATGWSDTAPSWAAGKYIWVRTVVSYGNGTTDITDPIVVTGNDGAKGDTGAEGADGSAGKGISSTAITYQLGPSGTTAPTGAWSSSVPSLSQGKYLWTRIIWTYSDGSTQTGYSTSYIAQDGSDGSDGIAGKDGVGISSTTITYQGSTSGTSAPTGSWSSSIPSVVAGSYLWTKTVWTYSDNSTETGYSVAKMGDTGATGSTGVSVSSITPYWAIASSAPAKPTAATPPSPWSATEPAYNVGQNLYRTEKVLYSNSSFAYTDVQLDSTYQYAALAKTTADGKNKIIASQTEPSHTGLVNGDFWFQTNSSSNVMGIQIWNGSSFVDYRIIASEILVASTVGTTEIADNAIVTGKIAANAITAIKIAAQTITGDKLDVGSVAAAVITSGLFQTASIGARVAIDSNGITAYDANGNVTLYISASDGSLTANKGTITGATVRTSSSSSRTEMNDTGMTVYKSGTAYAHMGSDSTYGIQAWNPVTSSMVDLSSMIFGSTQYQSNDRIMSPIRTSTGVTGWQYDANESGFYSTTGKIKVSFSYSNNTTTDNGTINYLDVAIFFTTSTHEIVTSLSNQVGAVPIYVRTGPSNSGLIPGCSIQLVSGLPIGTLIYPCWALRAYCIGTGKMAGSIRDRTIVVENI